MLIYLIHILFAVTTKILYVMKRATFRFMRTL